MRHLASRSVLVGLAVGALLATDGRAIADTVVVTADAMVDVATGRLVAKPMLTVVDGRITRVGKQGDAAPAGASRVDLPGVTLLPGLIDMHTHLTSSPLFGATTACSSPTRSGR
jgi:imidazolonepropionase-like amidohydrolase